MTHLVPLQQLKRRHRYMYCFYSVGRIKCLTLLHSEWPKLHSFGHSECNRVKRFMLPTSFYAQNGQNSSECNRVKHFMLPTAFYAAVVSAIGLNFQDFWSASVRSIDNS